MVSGPAVAAGAVSPPHEHSSCEVPPPPGKEAQGNLEGLLSETVMCNKGIKWPQDWPGLDTIWD